MPKGILLRDSWSVESHKARVISSSKFSSYNNNMIKRSIRIFYVFGLQDIKQRYRRSSIGPFWLTISMTIMISSLGFLYGALFNTPVDKFLPFLAAGLLTWNLISSSLNESCNAFIDSKGLINQGSIYYWSYILRVVWRNVIIFFHNIMIIPIIMVIFNLKINWELFFIIPGFALLCCNLIWMGMLLALICTRFRDVPQIIQNAVQIIFFLTPIMWLPSTLLKVNSESMLLDLNPFYHLIDLVRLPILGDAISNSSWVISISLLIFGAVITMLICKKFNHRIPFWL